MMQDFSMDSTGSVFNSSNCDAIGTNNNCFTTPFSAKDILNKNINVHSEFANNLPVNIKKEFASPYDESYFQQFWYGSLYSSNEQFGFCHNYEDNFINKNAYYCDNYYNNIQNHHGSNECVQIDGKTKLQECDKLESPRKYCTYLVNLALYF